MTENFKATRHLNASSALVMLYKLNSQITSNIFQIMNIFYKPENTLIKLM